MYSGTNREKGIVMSQETERAEFEAEMRKQWVGHTTFQQNEDGGYIDRDYDLQWHAWQARARLGKGELGCGGGIIDGCQHEWTRSTPAGTVCQLCGIFKPRGAALSAKPVEVGELRELIYDETLGEYAAQSREPCHRAAQAILSRYNVTLKESV
jgi:hypothetical protein